MSVRVDDSLDLGFATGSGADLSRWHGLGRMFLPGYPHHTAPGRYVWLREGHHLFYRYQIRAIVYDDRRVSIIDGEDFGSGWSLLLVGGTGQSVDVRVSSISDPDAVGATWGRGIRYLRAGPPLSFVRVGTRRKTPRWTSRFVPTEEPSTEPNLVITPASARENRKVEAKLIQDFVSWINGPIPAFNFSGLQIKLSTGTLRVDLFHTRANLLIEAKAQSSRIYVRYAVGQLLDYVSHIDFNPLPGLVLLLPSRPAADLQPLLNRAGIDVIWRATRGFADGRDGELIRTIKSAKNLMTGG